MKITRHTKLKDLLAEYPWLKEEALKISDKFRIINTAIGRHLLGQADIATLSRKSGLTEEVIIDKIHRLIEKHHHKS